MQSTAPTVALYLEEAPTERKIALTRLRELCLSILTGCDERMQYGGPCYSRGSGEPEVGFASQIHFIALYILRNDVMDAYRELLKAKGVSLGKGCIRYASPGEIDFALVEQLLKATRESSGAICA
jgi:hypothetical protein